MRSRGRNTGNSRFAGTAPRTGLARALSKLGYCSRSQAVKLIAEGRVMRNGLVCLDPETPVQLTSDLLSVDGQLIDCVERVYLMLNKPRGVVTSTADEKGRPTVYSALTGQDLPWVAPVGRLDKASEGLLLLSNDTAWAARITEPTTGLEKTYHLQLDQFVSPALCAQMVAGIASAGEQLAVKRAELLRSGQRTCWLEVVIAEGRNRHLRRIAQALDLTVLRLVRIAIGELTLGDLAKGTARTLKEDDFTRLGVQPSIQRSG